MRSFYFADKPSAERFKRETRGSWSGRVTLRATLTDKRCGAATYRDTRHVGGFTVRGRPYSFGALVEIAEVAKRCGRMSAPHAT